MSERIVIVGGGPAALCAARGYRAAGGTGTVRLVTDDDRPPYERPPLTKEHLRGESESDALPMEGDGWYAEHGVELVYATATGLDADARRVTLDDGGVLDYDGLALATGSKPIRLPLDGADDSRVHLIRQAVHGEGLRDLVFAGTQAVVIGTGFIGCEAAVSLARRGAQVTVVGQEPIPNAARIGEAAGARVAGWLEDEGVEARHGAAVEAIETDGVRLAHETLPAEIVLMAAGVRPRDELARDAGLRLGSGGAAIATDADLRTTGDRVYAAGDVCEAWHPVAGRPLRVEHWGDALAQGEAAGRRLAGDREARWDAVPGFWSQIGDRWLKHAAWGDGFTDARLVDHPGGGWTVWYADADGVCVGVLTFDADDDYERGEQLVAEAAPCP